MAVKRSFAILFLLTASAIASPHNNPPPKGGPNSCKKTEFYYADKNCCLPNGGPPNPPPPPPDKSCPSYNWYWHEKNKCCVPARAPPPNSPPPQCPKGSEWDSSVHYCGRSHGTPTISHKPSQTPTYPGHGGGPHNPPPPPKGYPNHPGKGPEPPKGYPGHPGKGPEPPKGYPGHPGKGPQPPKGYPAPPAKGSHNWKKRSVAPLCPRSFEACSISGLTGSEYECLDTTAELRSCGGCVSTGKGQDCTAIKGAWNVGCESGSCAVYTCALGYKVSSHGNSCIEN